VEHLLVYSGKVAEEIVDKAHRFGCEAIVLGAHNKGFLKRLFSSNTVTNVLRQTKKPVFLASMKEGKVNITDYNNSEILEEEN
jgi:nucleotide-binding universal stress UspA family protein